MEILVVILLLILVFQATCSVYPDNAAFLKQAMIIGELHKNEGHCGL